MCTLTWAQSDRGVEIYAQLVVLAITIKLLDSQLSCYMRKSLSEIFWNLGERNSIILSCIFVLKVICICAADL